MARQRARDKNWERKVWYVVGGVATLGLAYGGYKIYQQQQIKRAVSQHSKYVVDGLNLDQAAIEIYDAFWNWGWAEDEEAAIAALKRVPLDQIQTVAFIYSKKYDKNLYEDFRNYLSQEQYDSIRNLMQ